MALTKVSGSILKDPLNLGEVSIGGTLTYQDVTNVDSVGVITARSGINVTGGDITIPDSIIHLEDTNTKIRFPAADTVTVETAGNEALRVDSSQRLLIGTTTEGQADADNLTVADSGSCGITIRSGTSAAGAIYFSDATSGAAEYDGAIVYNQSSQFMAVYTAQTERLRIDSSGHMGLGISPSDIDSIGKALNIASSTGGAIYLQDTDDPTVKFAAISYNGTNAGLQIHAHHSSSYIDLGTNGTERLRIASDGKVGIGTDTPNGNLQIRAGQNANFRVLADPSTSGLFVGNYGSGDGYRSLSLLGSNIRLYTITAGALSGAQERFHIASDGKVGINQTPDAAGGLVQIRYNEVYTSGTTNLLTAASKAALRIRTSSDSSKSLFFGGIDESATPYLQVGNMSSASGGATATYPLVFQPYGGNVGIGTDNPSQIFNICGTNVKPVIGDRTAHTPLYSSYNGQNNTSLEITSSGTGTNVAGLTINNPTTSAGTSYKTISFSCSGTSSAEKRAAIISSNHDADGSSSLKGNFYVSTNNGSGLQQNLQINHNGYVTKPNNAMFKVRRTNNQAVSSNGWVTIQFNNKTATNCFDIGGNFNTGNYRFTAPVTGYYQFGLNQRVDGADGDYFRVAFSVDGDVGASNNYPYGHAIYRDVDGFAYYSFSITSLIYLTSGQYVRAEAYAHSDTTWYLQDESLFYGYLVG